MTHSAQSKHATAGGTVASVEQDMDLKGQLLVAMPSMGDPRFEHAVIYLCAHGEDGAMGLIVNKPMEDVTMGDIWAQLELEAHPDARSAPVFYGGPVEVTRGFVLHSDEYTSALQTVDVGGGFGMTATQDILEDMGRGMGPLRGKMALGYAGWGPGQLEQEIGQNGWITMAADPDLVFGAVGAAGDVWHRALKQIGIDAITLSGAAGRA